MDNNIAERIKIKRLEMGISQGELGQKASIAPAQISRYESGLTKPSNLVASRLAKALNVNLEWLLTGSPDLSFKDAAPQNTTDRVKLNPESADDVRLSVTVPYHVFNKLQKMGEEYGLGAEVALYLLILNNINNSPSSKSSLVNFDADMFASKIIDKLAEALSPHIETLSKIPMAAKFMTENKDVIAEEVKKDPTAPFSEMIERVQKRVEDQKKSSKKPPCP